MDNSVPLLPGGFAKATAIKQIEDNAWEGNYSVDWMIGQTMSGGYAMSVGARVLGAALPHPDPVTVTGHFLARTEVGPVRCEVEVLREGRGSSSGVVKLIQNGELKIQVIGVYGDMNRQRGESLDLEPIPDMPSFEQCEALQIPDNQPFRKQLVQRMAPLKVRALEGEPDGSGIWRGWLDLADGNDKDIFSILMFADALPPPVFSIYGTQGRVPTLDLSVQLHRRPCHGPLRCIFRTNIITEGIVNEEGLIWDSEDNIIALSRQTAKYRLPQ